MFSDLCQLLANTRPDAAREDYATAVLRDNLLGKPTKKARELAFRHLATLYALDPTSPLFRALRRLWPLNPEAQPILALTVALARDPLLRATQPFFLGLKPGSSVPRDDVEQYLEKAFPDRFSPASLKSFAQNVGGTWTDAGLLQGRVRKVRSLPTSQPESVALLLFLGYLEGRSGQRLFSSDWLSLLCTSPDEIEALAVSASHRGLMVFMNAGGVKEVRFPDYLTPDEEKIRQEVAHVI